MSARAPVRRTAAFAPSSPPTPRCPVCWSAPFLGAARKVRRGWRVQAEAVESATGNSVPVATSVYPCSNVACDTAIVVRVALVGGYLQSDVDDGLLRDEFAHAFSAGKTKRDGVWRDRLGDARTAPVQRDLFAV